MPLPGESLHDRYLLKREIGRGGMAEVHLAYDSFAQRDVAIKFIRLDAFNDAAVGSRLKRLWLNETRLAGKLHHPHIVETFEAGVSDTHAFLVMEYVEGDSLQRHAAVDGLLPVESVADIVFKVAGALDYASRLGLLHRDIKPANVVTTVSGATKLMDFGACYFMNVEDTQVYDVGTLPFMPPEHFANWPPSVQSDIYALGVLAYQLLTGRLPFGADTLQGLIHEKLNSDYVPLEIRRKDLPGELRFVVHRAMHRDMEVRYKSWRAFCDDLARALPEGDQPREVLFDSSRFTALRQMPLFAHFPETQLWEMVHMSRWTEKADGDIVFHAGDLDARIFIIVSGEVTIRHNNVVLNSLGAGECFGEIAYLHEAESKRTATAAISAPTVLIEIDAEALQTSSDSLQAVFMKVFLRKLIESIRRADARLLEQAG
jgi:serine/threonine protein kinase